MNSKHLTNLFSLNPGSGVPIYRQLIAQIKQSIRLNLLAPGQQLPSVRSLATKLQINPMTISKAFAQLEIEGVLNRKLGVGMLVASNHIGKELPENVENTLKTFIKTAKSEHLNDEEIVILVQQFLSINPNNYSKKDK